MPAEVIGLSEEGVSSKKQVMKSERLVEADSKNLILFITVTPYKSDGRNLCRLAN